jgi:LCP family protein required for cell wall assembly
MARLQNRARSAPPSGRRRRLWLRLLGGFVVAVLLGLGGAAGAVHWGLAKIDRTLVAGLVGAEAQAAAPDAQEPQTRLLNVLVVGNDRREGLTREQIREFGTGQAEGNRTDSLMLLQLELDGEGRGAVLSFPRDLLVERCDGSHGRINAAYQVGIERDGDGPSCVVETVAEHTGVDIHHYLEVSFAGFVKVVDALGGVGLYLDEPMYDAKAHLDLPAGCVRLEGAQALGFVRARHLDNDFGRIARQQRFIKETLREATQLGVLANPPQLLRIIDAAASSVQTDDRLGLAEMREIALGMRRLTAQGLAVHTVPGEAQLSAGTWYVREDEMAARQLFASFADGSVLRDGPPVTERPTVKAKPTVDVLNASDEAGLAAAAAEYLESEGFTIGEVGNAELGGLETTRILYGPELAEQAAELIELFGDADVIEGVSGLPLTLKLGADASVAQLRELIPEPSPSAEPVDDVIARRFASPTPSPQPTYRGAEMTDVDC